MTSFWQMYLSALETLSTNGRTSAISLPKTMRRTSLGSYGMECCHEGHGGRRVWSGPVRGGRVGRGVRVRVEPRQEIETKY